ncbi:MAG TPA: triose-phosphate isomerase [Terriglobia bacterium]|nr:triose-phosphate isomerase [Terriglobia bacterium]
MPFERRPVIAGNWKMFKTIPEAVDFVQKLKPLVAKAEDREVVVAPPFTALSAVAAAARGSNIQVAAQDMHWDKEGAHTADVSAGMILDAGCAYVIIGHSERRQDHAETDEQVNRKVKAALAAGLLPIACVGETLTEREAGRTEEVLQRQFRHGFLGLTAQEFSRIIIAYEPVWAIGTGRTATPEMAAESHRFLRGLAGELFGEGLAAELRILYGGSVKPDNVAGLMAQEEIDGALVGGASLKADSFSAIVNYSRK